MLSRKISMLNEQERDYVDSLYVLFGVDSRAHERIKFLRARLVDRRDTDRKGRSIERRALRNLEAVFMD